MNGFSPVAVHNMMEISGGYNCDGNPSGTNNWTGGASKASDFPPDPLWDVYFQSPAKVGFRVSSDGSSGRIDVGYVSFQWPKSK